MKKTSPPSTRSLRTFRALSCLALSGLLLAACGGGGGSSGDPVMATPMGSLRLALTDAPSCGYEQVNVSIEKIRVHQSASAADADAGWSEIALSPAKRVDLLSLTNGVLAELGQTALPAGRYTQMRLLLASNEGATPLANSVIPTGGAETALRTPSAQQSGLKMNIDIAVAANQVADLVLDFDACRSVVKLGNSGGFNLKPVVSVLPRVSDAANRVIGYVPSALAASTAVSAQLNGVPVKATVPDASGKFVLTPLPTGSYDVVVASVGHATATVTGVPVSNSSNTVLNSSVTPIDAPASAMRVASGNVVPVPAVTPIEALIVARKIYSGGPTVEVAAQAVDGLDGSFSFSLPAAPAVKAAYTAGAALLFSADTGVPVGGYSLVAGNGAATKTLAIDLSTADATKLNLTLP
jgi:hypothetical protein